MKRICPVCRLGVIERKGVKTCGALECQKEWQSWSATSRVKAISLANMPAEEILSSVGILTPTGIINSADLQEDDVNDEAAAHILKILGGPNEKETP